MCKHLDLLKKRTNLIFLVGDGVLDVPQTHADYTKRKNYPTAPDRRHCLWQCVISNLMLASGNGFR